MLRNTNCDMSRLNSLSVPHGIRVPKACLPCAKVKARCEIVAGVETCKRCRRLKKACNNQTPGAHRRTTVTSHNVVGPEEGPDDTGSPDPPPLAVFIDQVATSDSEGEKILQAYRKDMEPQFPFVLTSPSMSFVDLKEHKPLLVLAILMVGLRHDQVRQTTIARKIRDIISHDLLIRNQGDFDLLQCLLIYVNWYHFHLHLGSQLCNFVHLIMAVNTELGLNKEASTNALISGFGRFGYFGRAGSVLNMTVPKGVSTRTLDERRAFLGCFFLTSVVSMCIRDIEPIRYSKYVDECCRILIEAAKFPTDISVVHLTRLHGLAQKIARTFTIDDYYMTTNFTAAPIGACVKALEADLLRLRNSLPEGFHYDALLLIHYHVVEIFLYERAVEPKDQSSEYGTYPFARLHVLSACLESIRLCLDVFHSIPHSRLFDVPYTTLTFLSHAVVVLSKLSLLRTEDWDHTHAQNVLNFSEAMDRLIQKVNDAKALAENTAEGENGSSLLQTVPKLFSKLPDTLKKIKDVHETMYAAQASPSDQRFQLPSAGIGGTFTEDEFLRMSAPSFSDFFIEDVWQHLTWS